MFLKLPPKLKKERKKNYTCTNTFDYLGFNTTKLNDNFLLSLIKIKGRHIFKNICLYANLSVIAGLIKLESNIDQENALSHPLCWSVQKQMCNCSVQKQWLKQKHEGKKKQKSAMVALLLLHIMGFHTDHPHCEEISQVKVPYRLKESLHLIRSQAMSLTETIGTSVADGLFYSWIVT